MRTVWLASYPKSGNTWFRMFAINLSREGRDAADINDLAGHGGMASARGVFDFLTLIESSLLSFDEADALRPLLHQEIAKGTQDDDLAEEIGLPAPVRFIKTHDAYTLTRDGVPLLGGRAAACGAILIVRDPRDVAPSLANHNAMGINDTILMMNDPGSAFCDQLNQEPSQFRQKLLTWSAFQKSWLEQTDLPVYVLRYEDLTRDPVSAFTAALAFARHPATAEQIARAVDQADFAKLKAQEREKGFRETPLKAPGGFFRRGEAGAWREELTPEQVEKIEADHGDMMVRLGYAVVC